jgi:hypothetical protein
MSLEQLLARLFVAGALSLLGLALFWGWNRFQLRRLGRATGDRLRGLENLQPGVPGILYFTTTDCQVCLTAQKPALKRLEAAMGSGVQIVEVDAAAQPDLANYWGVLSVPTTFIINALGQPRHINHGLTGTEKLRRQIEDTQSNGAQFAVAQGGVSRPVGAGQAKT